MSNALPGWNGYIAGTNQTSLAIYNGVSAGSALITLIGSSSIYSNSVIGGKYTATLDAGIFTDSTGVDSFAPAAIAQTGTIPLSALSLRFDASGNVVGYVTVMFGGQNVPFYPLSAGPNYELYGADISGYAGQTGELRFSENQVPSNHFGVAFLDNIVFSTSPVPEPGTGGVILFGAAVIGMCRWRRCASSTH